MPLCRPALLRSPPAGPKVGFVSGYYYVDQAPGLPFLEVPLAVDAAFNIDRVRPVHGPRCLLCCGASIDLSRGCESVAPRGALIPPPHPAAPSQHTFYALPAGIGNATVSKAGNLSECASACLASSACDAFVFCPPDQAGGWVWQQRAALPLLACVWWGPTKGKRPAGCASPPPAVPPPLLLYWHGRLPCDPHHQPAPFPSPPRAAAPSLAIAAASPQPWRRVTACCRGMSTRSRRPTSSWTVSWGGMLFWGSAASALLPLLLGSMPSGERACAS